jgi:hypothetical protein
MLKTCNKCLFKYEETNEPDYPVKSALYKTNGFIFDFSVMGGYYSVDLVDCHQYDFSLCENCICNMFNNFLKKPKVNDVTLDGQIRNEVLWEHDREIIKEVQFHSETKFPFKAGKRFYNICQFNFNCEKQAEFSYFKEGELYGDAICFEHKQFLENSSNNYIFIRDSSLAKNAYKDNFDKDNFSDLDKVAQEYSKVIKNGTKLQFIPQVLYHKVFNSYQDYQNNYVKYYCEIHSLEHLFPCHRQIDFGNKILYIFERTKEEINEIYPDPDAHLSCTSEQIEESEKWFDSLSEKDGFTLLRESLEEKDNIEKLRDKIAKIDIHKLY